MKNILLLVVVAGAITNVTAHADDSATTHKKATFSISGLHCPPCAGTVQRGLVKVKGVKSATVDYQSKSAKVEFDESVASAQSIATAIAATPHMMGANMTYVGWLALSVPDVKDGTSAKKAKDALVGVTGISKVNANPKQHTVSVQFASGKDVTSETLIEALSKVGMTAKTY